MGKGLWAFANLALLLFGPPAAAQPVALEGYLIALDNCHADRTVDARDAGNVRLEMMRAYDMLARNDTPGTHYQIRVPGADPEERWVAKRCGVYAPKSYLVMSETPARSQLRRAQNQPGKSRPETAALLPDSLEMVLAASWQPGFCQTRSGRDKAECRSQTADRFDATHFSIHGLWPDDLDDKRIFPCYCDRGAPVSCGGRQEPEARIDLSATVLDKLEVAMPGVQSDLHLHEWTKHGSCYEDDETGADADAGPDEYFSETMALLDGLNGSAVRKLFTDKLGEVVSREEIEATFDEAFGEGAGERVIVRCSPGNGETVIDELWIGLKGDISAEPDLGALIRAAPIARDSSDERSCASGRVVKVGDKP